MKNGSAPRSLKVKNATPNKRSMGAKQKLTHSDKAVVVDASKTPIPSAIDTVFQNDNIARETLAKNLKARSTDSNALIERAHKVFSGFNPSRFSPVVLDGPNYLGPTDDLTKQQLTLFKNGLKSIQISKVNHSIRLAAPEGMSKVISKTRSNTGVVVHKMNVDNLVTYINSKSQGRDFFAKDSVFTKCTAEIEAEEIANQILNSKNNFPLNTSNSPASSNTSSEDDASIEVDSDALHLTSSKLVKEKVDLQMDTVTSPESQLRWNVPNRSIQKAGRDNIQLNRSNQQDIHENIQKFELRSGPSDVTSYHDFYSLQIAFESIWTEMFDGQLANLGKELYMEYVKFKNFSGGYDEPDPIISSIDELKQFMAKVKGFAQLTIEQIPPGLKPDAGGSTTKDGSGGTDDLVKIAKTVFLPWEVKAFEAFAEWTGGVGYTLMWESFETSLPGGDKIDVTILNDVVDPLHVRFVLESPSWSWKKRITFTDVSTDGQTDIYNYPPSGSAVIESSMDIDASLMGRGMLTFTWETTPGISVKVYKLADLGRKLRGGSKVTFNWLHNWGGP